MPKAKLFKPEQFTDMEWEAAEAKAKFANHFVEFVESGYDRQKFPAWFYKRLSMTFGMIAHYDQQGFYSTFFEDAKGKLDFEREILSYPCYGDPKFTYCDVEKVLISWLKDYRSRIKRPKTDEEYVAASCVHCPYCDSTQIEATESPQVDGGSAYQKVNCLACDKSWDDHYKLVGYVPRDA